MDEGVGGVLYSFPVCSMELTWMRIHAHKLLGALGGLLCGVLMNLKAQVNVVPLNSLDMQNKKRGWGYKDEWHPFDFLFLV
eukprot:1161605-Pelagomonas_calceolata.AAC.4